MVIFSKDLQLNTADVGNAEANRAVSALQLVCDEEHPNIEYEGLGPTGTISTAFISLTRFTGGSFDRLVISQLDKERHQLSYVNFDCAEVMMLVDFLGRSNVVEIMSNRDFMTKITVDGSVESIYVESMPDLYFVRRFGTNKIIAAYNKKTRRAFFAK